MRIIKRVVRRVLGRLTTDKNSNIATHAPTEKASENGQIVTTGEFLQSLDDPFRSALVSMYNGDPQIGIDGRQHSLDAITKISPEQGMWLYDFCLSNKPSSSLEIGMAYGFSTMFFLAAIEKNQTGQHTAIDPFQTSYWKGIGLALAKKHSAANPTERAFRFIEDFSVHAATDLSKEKMRYDLIFIDGNHRYDDVLADFYLYAQITSTGGHIVFDDMWMSSVKTVVEFIRTNRPDFREVTSSSPNVSVFRKVGEDERAWDIFREFKVSPSAGVN